MHETPASALNIRALMPAGFIKTLALRTGCKNPGRLSSIVSLENTGAKEWPAVEALARETNPEGFAQWQTAQEQPATAA